MYGSDFFNTFQTSFMPINEPNPDSGYILDTGDVLTIQLVGQDDFIEDFIINRDGAINLPNIGKIFIAGLSLGDASKMITYKINEALLGSDVYINLSQIRDINILVSGNAKNPGIYTLNGNSNILHAISSAGGISEFGSLREIKLLRNNEVIETLDLYDLLINGKYNLTKRLRSGDVIFVEAKKIIVTIDGAVNRPGKYEVFQDQKLDSLIKYANGLKNSADLENITLERVLDGTLKSIPITNPIQFNSIQAFDRDLVYVREHPFREAKISGAVQKPGTYIMAQGETVSNLIEKAGGFAFNAYPFGAVYETLEAKEINSLAKQRLYEQFLDSIITISSQGVGGDFDWTPIITLADQIKNSNDNGRVVIDLLDDSSVNLYAIKEGDELFIPELSNVVYVYGESSTEGAVMFNQNKGVEYYVEKAGGYTKYADNQSIYVLHPSGESQLYTSKRNIFENSPKSKLNVYPGSIIFIPKKLDDSAPKRIAAQAYVSILGNLGIALASLSSISNN